MSFPSVWRRLPIVLLQIGLLSAASGVIAPVESGGAMANAGEPPARRIVTLAPHLAELVFAADAGEWLVGTVEYSDFPPAATTVPRIGDAFRVDRERLARLAPDLILAWDGGTPSPVIERLREDGHRVVVLSAERPEDVAAMLISIGRLVGTEDAAHVRAATYRSELDALRRRYADLPAVRVFVQIAARPLYTVNDRQMIGQVVSLCGGANIFGGLSELAPVVGAEAVVAADPEVILSTADAAAGGDPFGQWRHVGSLRAVRNDRLYAVESDRLSRAGLRLAEGAAEVCDRIDQAR